MTFRIESLLSARLFMSPQRVGQRLYFISNLSGQMSLYAMDWGGSVPEPLLPPHIALQNPKILESTSFYVFPELGKILVTMDTDGDENYQPMFIPLEGGFPEPIFPELAEYRVHTVQPDAAANIAYFMADSRTEQRNVVFKGDLKNGTLTKLYESKYGSGLFGIHNSHQKYLVGEGYTYGDTVLYLHDGQNLSLLYGTPIGEREAGKDYPPSGLGNGHLTDKGVIAVTGLFEDTFSLGYIALEQPGQMQEVSIQGKAHSGVGELYAFNHLTGNRYLVGYNIDGVSWYYEGVFDEAALTLTLTHVLTGQGALSNGVVQAIQYDKATGGYVLSFSSATSPTQIYTLDGAQHEQVEAHTHERLLGIAPNLLAPGEDASFTSHDGLRISARLYLPAEELGFQAPYPLIYYVHGGPQSQERPDFTWFSMPLIQYFTLRGFAVFVPNARGSTGYGMDYTKRVDRDWGGQDRLDHVHAMGLLAQDSRLDTQRAGVVGRSYGGYMTLTLAGRHPELWRGAVDMFGPYDLLTFGERIPETWKVYFELALGHPERDRDFLVERSPKTHLHNLACPMLVIQGRNDPRVVEQESVDLVEGLRAQGKHIEFLLFENEGHDVLKFENRVTCYNAIVDFFQKVL